MAIVRPRTSGFIVDPLLAQQRKEAAAREANLERSLQFLNQAFLQQSAIDYAKEQKELDALAKKAKAEGDAARNRMADDQFMQAPGLTGQQVRQGLDTEQAMADMMFDARAANAEADAMAKRAAEMLAKEEAAAGSGAGFRRISGPATPVASTRQQPYDAMLIADQQQVMDDDSARAMQAFNQDEAYARALREIVDEQENVRQINAMLAPLMAASRPSATATQPSIADRMPTLPALQLPGTSGFPTVSGAVDPQVLQLMQTLAGSGIDPRTIARFLDPMQPDMRGQSAGRVMNRAPVVTTTRDEQIDRVLLEALRRAQQQ